MSTETAEAGELSLSWPRQYLRDHTVHIAVVVVFAAYPFVYDFLVNTLGTTAEMVLPQMATMVALMWLGLFTMSFDFISGYTGYLSFGHAAFFGTGAYFTILAWNGRFPLIPAGADFMALMLLAGLVAMVVAFLIGLVSFRLTGVYFAMITLGFAELLFVISEHWDWLTPGTAVPEDGITMSAEFGDPGIGVPFVDVAQVAIGGFGDSAILGIELGIRHTSFYMLGLVVVVCYLAMQRIIHSPFGRTMIAIRENEERAKAIGYRTIKFKLGAFMFSAFFAGIAGAMVAGEAQAAGPDDAFFFLVTGFALVAAIIGGLGTLAGPLFGYIFLESVEEFLSRPRNGGGLQPFLRETLPDSVLNAEVASGTVDGIIGGVMTGHGELYAGIIFIIFILYVPIGMLGTVRAKLGGTTVANAVSTKIRARFE
ncbi:MAG: branched-chain amino acid ABC transporter permease [Halovenus sp.]